jgi:cAMP-dependent protein kinase regulator
MTTPPPLPGLHADETPIDRALTLRLAGEKETALRWAAASLQAEPELPSALLLVSELLAELGRREPAREGLEVCVVRAIDAGLLPLAVAGAIALRNLGADSGRAFDAVADAFCASSARLDDDSQVQPPPPPRGGRELQPLSSLLMGPSLLNKAVEVLRGASGLVRKFFQEETSSTFPAPMVPRLPLFSSLSREGLRALIEVFEARVVEAGGVVIEEGATGSEAFIVARGELEVRRGHGGDATVLARLQNGAVFGEMALVSRAPRAASVVATRPSIVLRASVEALEQVATRAAEVGDQLASFCRERMLQNLVRTSPILGVVAPEERQDLVGRFETRTFESGERLIRRGEPPSGVHLIASGEVEVVTEDASGERLVIASLGPGDVVGEVAMILRRMSSANVIAVHPTVTLHLSGTGFQEMMRAHPTLLAELYDLAVKRDEETSSVVAQESTSADDYVLV